MIVKIDISDLYIPQGLLPRVITGTIPEKVEEYAEMIKNGVEFDPILVWKNPRDGKYWIVDGNHRYLAHQKAGKTYIQAKLKDLNDEKEFRKVAIKANLKHGIPLTREEKIENARTLYLQGDEPKEIAELFGVEERTVYNWIKDLKNKEKLEKEKLKQKALELYREGYTQEEIAKNLGISQQRVSYMLNSLQKNENFQNFVNTPEGEEEYDGSWDDWNEEEPAAEEKPKSKQKKEKELLPPTKILERNKDIIWDALIEIEFHFGLEKALEIAEEFYFALKEKTYKDMEDYKDRKALFDFNRLKGRGS